MLKRLVPSFLESRWLMLAVLVVFVCFKVPQLHYPFYIDEGWVYAPAVKTMAINGPSLMPGSLLPDYSRGHPLMFHFLCSLWIRCFGASNIAIHSFPLFLSVVFLITLYEACLRLFGKVTAALVLVLVCSRVIFFVQSSFVYPEVMVAMFTFLSLYFYSRDRLLLTSLMLFMLFFTKEGGLVFGAVIGCDALVSLFRNTDSLQRRVLRVSSTIAPALLIGIFLLLQKRQYGWYVFPEHTSMIIKDWDTYYFMFRRGLYWAYRGDSALCVMAVFIALLSLVPALKYKNARYLFLVPPIVVVYTLAELFASNPSGSVVLVLVYILSFTVPVVCVLQLNKSLGAPARKFIMLLSISVVAFLFYSSLTSIGYRYLLVDVVLLLIFLAVCINTFIDAGGKAIPSVAFAGILLIGAYGFYSNERHEDTQLGAFRVMNVQLQELAFLEKENAYHKEMAFGCIWESLRFTDTMQGFVSPGHTFTNMKRFPLGPQTEYAMFGNSCEDEKEYPSILSNPSFHLVYKVRDKEIWAEIYKRNWH